MKPFSIHCTTCRAKLVVRKEAAIGQILSCPKCSSMVLVERPGQEPATTTEAPVQTPVQPPRPVQRNIQLDHSQDDGSATAQPPASPPRAALPVAGHAPPPDPSLPDTLPGAYEDVDELMDSVGGPTKTADQAVHQPELDDPLMGPLPGGEEPDFEPHPEATSPSPLEGDEPSNHDGDQAPAASTDGESAGPMLPTGQWTSSSSKNVRHILLLGVTAVVGVALAVGLFAWLASGPRSVATGPEQPAPDQPAPDQPEPIQPSPNQPEPDQPIPDQPGPDPTEPPDGQPTDPGVQPPTDPVGGLPSTDPVGGLPSTDPKIGDPGTGDPPATGDPPKIPQIGPQDPPNDPMDPPTPPGAEPPGLTPKPPGDADGDDTADVLKQFSDLFQDTPFPDPGTGTPADKDDADTPGAPGSDPKAVDPKAADPATPPGQPGDPASPVVPTAPAVPRPPARQVDVVARLADPFLDIEFTDTPLIGFLRFTSECSTIPISLDTQALRRLKLTVESPVTVQLKNTDLAGALKAALQPLGLTFQTINNEQLWVTGADNDRVTAVGYDVTDLVGQDPDGPRRLGQWIEQLVDPPSWQKAGGKGELKVEGRELNISTTAGQQFEILTLFEKLRVARKLALRSGYPADLFQLASRSAQIKPRLAEPLLLNYLQPVRFTELLDRLGQEAKVRILVDWQAAAAAGWAPHAEAKLNVDQVPLSAALNRLLRPMDLAARIVDGQTLEVTTRAQYTSHLDVEFYSIAAAIGNGSAPDAIIKRLTTAIGAENLASHGGSGTILFDRVSQCLLVRLSQPQQREVEKLLAEL